MTKLAGALPKEDRNGLGVIAGQMLRDPHRRHVVLAVVDCKKITTDTDTGDIEATARVLRIEAVPPDDMSYAERLLRRALERRTGETTLPFELESEISDLFAELRSVDLDDDRPDPDAVTDEGGSES